MICVLLVDSGAAWEAAALAALRRRPDVTVLRRCVDVDDLLAASTTGQADVAVVALDATGLDATAVDHLRRHGVRVVAVSEAFGAALDEAARARAGRIGAAHGSGTGADDIVAGVLGVDRDASPAPGGSTGEPEPQPSPTLGRLPQRPESGAAPVTPGHPRTIAVWGPAGAPGRTTVAVSLATALARGRRRALIVDADPAGGAVAQSLGLLEEVSGLLAVARAAGAGRLAQEWGAHARSLEPGLAVLTGLPRPDRWSEVRPGVLEHLLELVAAHAHAVIDAGAGLEDDPDAEFAGRPGRHHLTLASLAAADVIVAVGQPAPVGLSRLVRGLGDLREAAPGTPVHVVVNRVRPSLGWSEKEVAATVRDFARVDGVHPWPDDPAAADRALARGTCLLDGPASALTRAIGDLARTLDPEVAPAPARGARERLKMRTAGRARRR